jgi:hypothetical protein
VPLPTIGYGDIVPVTTAARLVNAVVITPDAGDVPARQVVIAAGRDETAVLIALTRPPSQPPATIVAAVREEDTSTCSASSAPDR